MLRVWFFFSICCCILSFCIFGCLFRSFWVVVFRIFCLSSFVVVIFFLVLLSRKIVVVVLVLFGVRVSVISVFSCSI